MQATAISPTMQQCIDECLHCYRSCLVTAMNHCLEQGGSHVQPGHFRLMLNCAELCRTSAEFLMSASTLHAHTCAACAIVCDACADSCAELGDMDECAEACRSCAAICHQMAAGGDGLASDIGAGRPVGHPIESASSLGNLPL